MINLLFIYVQKLHKGIFVNFKNIQRTSRKKVPFGIGQLVNHSEMKLHQVTLFLEQENLNKWN